jgi:hypothetical protein
LEYQSWLSPFVFCAGSRFGDLHLQYLIYRIGNPLKSDFRPNGLLLNQQACLLIYIMGDSETKDNTNKMVEITDILLYYERTGQEKSPAAKAEGLSVMVFGDRRPDFAFCLLHFSDMF